VFKGGHGQAGGAPQLGIVDDRLVAARLNSVSSMAFIGLPRPMNRAGIAAPVSGAAASLRRKESVAICGSSQALRPLIN
jgi:hypothetical protein